MPGHPVRKRARLPGFNYASPGACFVTVCTHKRACILSGIEGADVILSPLGEVVRATWLQLPLHFPCTEVNAFVVMPNHVHCILTLHGRGTACRARFE